MTSGRARFEGTIDWDAFWADAEGDRRAGAHVG